MCDFLPRIGEIRVSTHQNVWTIGVKNSWEKADLGSFDKNTA